MMLNKRFGKWKVVGFKRVNNRGIYAQCICDCGNPGSVPVARLRSGGSKSCGCLRKETAVKFLKTHGMSKTREYKTWCKIIDRCENKKSVGWELYGGRGISMCHEWRSSFEVFFAEMGRRPSGTSIDRVDNNLGYFAKNCRWATPREQALNRRKRK